jgi:hypothetical protein
MAGAASLLDYYADDYVAQFVVPGIISRVIATLRDHHHVLQYPCSPQ